MADTLKLRGGNTSQNNSFTGADREYWSKTAMDEAWREVKERSPKHGPALEKLFR